MKLKWYLLLFVILILAGFLRFYRLDTLPPSLEWDEVATGYDAYSILKTGRDQFGHFLPLTFRSLDDYKPPLYTYLTSLSIAILGWNDFAVRFPAAFLGTLSIFTTYLMTYALFKRRNIAILSALSLAISPWHVHFSRLALETNSTIFFTTLGLWAFLKGLKNGKWLPLSAFLLGLDLYLYHNARVFIPLLTIGLLILYWRELWQQKKYVIVSAIIAGVFVIRLIPILTSIEGQMRFQGTSIFSDARSLDINEEIQTYTNWKKDDANLHAGFAGRLFHSSKVFFGLRIFKNYLAHFDPTFWVFTDDNPRHHVNEMGLIYFVDLPFLFLSLYFLFRQKKLQSSIFLLIWFFLVPVPASVTRDAPHALRTAIFMPVFQIFVAVTLVDLYKKLKIHHILGGAFLLVTTSGYLLNSVFFFHQYFIHYAKDTSEFWQYGRKETVAYTESVKNTYQKIIVSTRLEQPHVFFLYYSKYDPQVYLKEGGTVSGGWAIDKNKFDKYEFKPIHYLEMKEKGTLFVGIPSEFSTSTEPLKKIYYLDGKEALWITE